MYYLRTAKGTKAKLKKRNLSAAIAPEVVAEAPVVEAPEIVVPTEETK